MDFLSFEDLDHLQAVELGTAGMEWPASTGPFTLTIEHIADVVVAANEDPHVIEPRVKLGHTSTVNGEAMTVDPFSELGDAAPAFGRVVNLRTENDGAVLVGDFVDVPAWLAEGMPSYFPNRSGEWLADVTTEGGKHYTMVLAAVSLLGTFGPGITDLEDLTSLLESGRDLEPASTGRSSVPAPTAPAADTSVSVDLIRRRFNFEWALENDWDGGVDTYWWWARDIRIDPAEVIVDDDEGGLWRVPFSTDGTDEVTFSDPVKVREEFVDLPAAAQPDAVQTAAPPSAGQRVLASNLGRPRKATPEASRAASRPGNDNDPEEGHSMTAEETRELLGLAEDATDEEVAARREQVAALETPETPEPGGEPDPEPEENPEDEPAAETEPEPVAATLPEGFVAVPKDQWAEVQAGAQQGTELALTAETKRRDDTIDAAVTKGKVRPAQRASLVNLHEQNRDGFYTLLTAAVDDGGLAEGLVPVDELGAANGDGDTATDAQHDRFMQAHYPQAARRRAARQREEV